MGCDTAEKKAKRNSNLKNVKLMRVAASVWCLRQLGSIPATMMGGDGGESEVSVQAPHCLVDVFCHAD